ETRQHQTERRRFRYRSSVDDLETHQVRHVAPPELVTRYHETGEAIGGDGLPILQIGDHVQVAAKVGVDLTQRHDRRVAVTTCRDRILAQYVVLHVGIRNDALSIRR